MSVGRFVVVSIVVHAALAITARVALPVGVERTREAPIELAFTLSPEALKAPIEAVGLGGVDGPEPERTTGLSSGPRRGRAGNAVRGSATGVHVEGSDPRDRFAAGAEDVRALTGWLAAGLAETDHARSPYDATSELGARDDASLGVRGSSLVAAGERGLDMIGTGHGTCAGDECAAGTIGGAVLGPGALGGRSERRSIEALGRARGRTLCITDDACGQRRRPLAGLSVVVSVHGALDQERARRVVARHRSAIRYCLEGAAGDGEALEAFVGPSGAVSRASSESACMRDLGERLVFPEAVGPSVVIVRARIVVGRW